MNTNDIIKIASKLPLADRANVAFSLALQGKEELASKIQNTVPFERSSQRHSSFTDRIESQYVLLSTFSAEYWKQKSIYYYSINALTGYDIYEENETISHHRHSRLESFQRLVALNLVPESLEKKYGIRCQSITHLIEGSQVFEETNHPIERLENIYTLHDEYISLFKNYIS